MIVAQSALQTGALGAAVGSIEAMSVISGSLFGLFLLDERVGAHGFFEISAVVVSIAAILGGHRPARAGRGTHHGRRRRRTRAGRADTVSALQAPACPQQPEAGERELAERRRAGCA